VDHAEKDGPISAFPTSRHSLGRPRDGIGDIGKDRVWTSCRACVQVEGNGQQKLTRPKQNFRWTTQVPQRHTYRLPNRESVAEP
jgi:hypothetical protein